MPPTRRLRWFRPDLEGIRGVAILLVVAYHADLGLAPGGFIGVDVFFVLSGYLITRLLVDEFDNSGRIDLAAFYGRRARRLLPASAVVLAATLTLGWFVYPPFQQLAFTGTALANALYASNLWFATEATNYLAADQQLNPFLHTWSLAVEEQFYLAWPLLLWIVLRRDRALGHLRSLFVLAALAAASFGLSVWLTNVAQPWAFFGSPSRAWEFAAGGIASLATRHPIPNNWITGAVSWCGLTGLGFGAVFFGSQTSFPGVTALLPVVATPAVIALPDPHSPTVLTRLLSHRALQFVGRLSYSWYLWHWPLLTIGEELFGIRPAIRVAAIFVALLASWLTFHVIERPVRASRSLASHRYRSLALAACVTICTFSVAAFVRAEAQAASMDSGQAKYTAAWRDLPVVYQRGCHAPYLQATLSDDCVFGDPQATGTVVLFGDSHAAQWFPAAERVAAARQLRLVSLTKSACPAMRVELFDSNLARPYWECSAWRDSAITAIIALKPVVVIVASSDQYVRTNQAHPVSLAEWQQGVRDTVSRFVAAGLRTLVIRDTPRAEFDVPGCLARHAWHPSWFSSDCTLVRENAVDSAASDAESRAVNGMERVHLVDFTDDICQHTYCETQQKDLVVFRDTHHLTSAYAASLAPRLGDEIDRVLRTSDSKTDGHRSRPVLQRVYPAGGTEVVRGGT